jgi:hypothetical protein
MPRTGTAGRRCIMIWLAVALPMLAGLILWPLLRISSRESRAEERMIADRLAAREEGAGVPPRPAGAHRRRRAGHP